MQTRPVTKAAGWIGRLWSAGAFATCVALVGSPAAIPLSARDNTPRRGSLVIVGGGPVPPSILERFVALAGGPDRARILVLPMASASTDSGPSQAEELRGLGAGAHSVTLSRDEALLAESANHLEGITGVWFTGGDQSRVTAAIGGTPFEDALHRLHLKGAAIGGNSAGAALMSPLMITGEERPHPGAGESSADDDLFDDIIRGRVVAVPGLGFLSGTIVDQHFVVRKRHNRLISLVLEHPDHVGVGIDERTALEVGPDGRWRVLGEGVAIVYDARNAHVPTAGPLAATELTMHVLPAGSTYDPEIGRATLPAPARAP